MEIFGTADQQAMLRRGRAAYALLKADPGLTYYGRMVGIARPEDGDLERFRALAQLVGATHYSAVPTDEAAPLAAEIEAQGLAVVRYIRWTGQADALAAARAVLADERLPRDLRVVRIDGAASAAAVQALADVALASAVLPIVGEVLRGISKPGLGLVALDAAGQGVACAAAASAYHPDHPTLGDQCWWGMLATRTDRRGAGIARILGAMAIVDMHDRFGFSRILTGVQAGNRASEAVCAGMGLRPEPAEVLNAIDPTVLSGGRMTS